MSSPVQALHQMPRPELDKWVEAQKSSLHISDPRNTSTLRFNEVIALANAKLEEVKSAITENREIVKAEKNSFQSVHCRVYNFVALPFFSSQTTQTGAKLELFQDKLQKLLAYAERKKAELGKSTKKVDERAMGQSLNLNSALKLQPSELRPSAGLFFPPSGAEGTRFVIDGKQANSLSALIQMVNTMVGQDDVDAAAIGTILENEADISLVKQSNTQPLNFASKQAFDEVLSAVSKPIDGQFTVRSGLKQFDEVSFRKGSDEGAYQVSQKMSVDLLEKGSETVVGSVVVTLVIDVHPDRGVKASYDAEPKVNLNATASHVDMLLKAFSSKRKVEAVAKS